MGVELVDDAARRVQAVVRAVIRGERLEHPALRLVGNCIAEDREVFLQISGLDDFGGIREADFRLIFDRRRRVDLRAALAIGKKHIESDAGRQCSLAVLAGDFDIGIAEAARTVGEHPAEDVPDDELLPRFE